MKQHFPKIIDLAGKCLFAWYVVNTVIYFYSGRFLHEITNFRWLFNGEFSFWQIHAAIQVPVSAIGAFVAIVLLYKRSVWGLIAGLLYWVLGAYINPALYFIPYELQVSQGETTTLLTIVHTLWAAITLFIIVAFYFSRKKQQPPQGSHKAAHNQSLKRDEQTAGVSE